jgi:hypothetical protein
MKSKVICLVLGTLVLSMMPLHSALSTMPTFRNELGEIIPVTDWGQPGVDFEDLQLIGCDLPPFIGPVITSQFQVY